ncbi:site-specific integrase [Palleronia sp. LCG004]|uniref:site-specific integrase n=1 Tax=Palleronia sp. LCG004 TaxID=3079304 RepID=UPI0029429027|nr:site-specific integrase [Palleronia sp. LCG004]WOI58092.1 site-specific integrase [Palleronia sp. LCG004]
MGQPMTGMHRKNLPPGTRLPFVATCLHAQSWLGLLANLGRSEHTVEAYGRGLDQYMAFCSGRGVDPLFATLEDVSLFVRWQRGEPCDCMERRSAVANSTLLQRLTAIRLSYDHLRSSRVRAENPVPRGYSYERSISIEAHSGTGRTLVAKVETLPKIPIDVD